MAIGKAYHCDCGKKYLIFIPTIKHVKIQDPKTIKNVDVSLKTGYKKELDFAKDFTQKRGLILVDGTNLEVFQCSCGCTVDVDLVMQKKIDEELKRVTPIVNKDSAPVLLGEKKKKGIMMNKKSILLIAGIIITIVLYYGYQKNVQGEYHVKIKSSQSKENIIRYFLGEIDNNYSLGNNEMIEGFNETKIQSNEYGDVTKVLLSNRFYIAKEYFEKMADSLTKSNAITDETSEIKEILIKAAKARIEAVDLYIKGWYLKEQIGKISITNTLTALKGGFPQALPEYHGEVEEGTGKIVVANSNVVDALRKIKNLIDKAYSDKTFPIGLFQFRTIPEDISYYSNVSESDFESYVEYGKLYLENNNFFEAIIAFNKALKIKPREKGLFIGLIKSYIGFGSKVTAEEKIKEALSLFPSDEELISLNAEVSKISIF